MSSGPAPSASPIPVVAAVVCRGDRYLLGKRPDGKRHAGLWEFPGGKRLGAESTLDAVQRELAEEMGLRVVALGRSLLSVADPGSPYVIDFVEAVVEGEPEAREHSSVAWLTAAELARTPLAPADARFAASLPRP